MSEPAKRIRRKPEVAEQEILDAAQELLEETDFRHLTVKGVMERTGMKRATFYSYFKNRNDLVMGLLGRIEDEMMEASSVWFEGDGGVARLHEALGGAIGVYARHGTVMRAAHEASFHDASVERYYRHGLLADLIEAVAARIKADNASGLASVPDPDFVAKALILMNSMVMAEYLGDSRGQAPEALNASNIWVWERAIYGSPPD